MAGVSRLLLAIVATCLFIFPSNCLSPNIELTVLPGTGNVTINSRITEPGGDLFSATINVIDARTHDVLWVERKIIQGSEANLSFRWPRQMWRIANGTNFVEPVLAVNTIDLPANESPFVNISAPSLLRLMPGAEEVTALAFFGQNGEFNSLTDLNGNSYYKSMELAKIDSPGIHYGRYVIKNITLVVGISTLQFLHRNIDTGLIAFPPMILSRSPIQHYTLTLERRAAENRSVIYELDAEDSAGSITKKFWNESIDNMR